MAVGKSGERADRDRLSIAIGGVQVAAEGEVVPGYDEAPVARHLKGAEIDIEVDVGIGRGRATVWPCDLTHGYISINAASRSQRLGGRVQRCRAGRRRTGAGERRA